ncbi:hypothetical protein NAF17_15420 [Mucilaginibacter sp. RB4R14]|uniref:hypothetical protein n=1 Tax=Mucilaginibacter aurantiaciroseus TaxID=2949308 RepID=UPI00209040EF|nr:hypothetical protein [Mucilaginibacter aurantiaciroseus]MCO5936932.1 hypothetical protein [Mucilaginibacter aurantiaciroseus]
MFSMVNQTLDRMRRAPLFKIQLIGLSKEAELTKWLFTIKPELAFDEVSKTDLIIKPAALPNREICGQGYGY